MSQVLCVRSLLLRIFYRFSGVARRLGLTNVSRCNFQMKNNHSLKMKLPKYNRPILWILAALMLLAALRHRSTHMGVVGAAGYNGPTSSQPLALSADDS